MERELKTESNVRTWPEEDSPKSSGDVKTGGGGGAGGVTTGGGVGATGPGAGVGVGAGVLPPRE